MSDFTRAICNVCWYECYPEKGEPIRSKNIELEQCVVCTMMTCSGIYTRINRAELSRILAVKQKKDAAYLQFLGTNLEEGHNAGNQHG